MVNVDDESGTEAVEMLTELMDHAEMQDTSSDSEDFSGENNDVIHLPTKAFPFRQIDYVWLFNPFTNFNLRPGFVLEDSSLSIEDYSQMRYINRNLLTVFLSQR